MSSFKVVLDACAIFPASIRDTLFRAADAGLYRIHLTDDILEELRRNLISQRGVPEDKARRLIDTIKNFFPESLITQHILLIESMPNNEKDRHVLAAAVACNAQVIVTQNLKDFPQHLLSPFEVEAQSPDGFLVHLFHLSPETMLKIIIEQAGDLRLPSTTVPELLDTLKQHVPTFVGLVENTLNPQASVETKSKTRK